MKSHHLYGSSCLPSAVSTDTLQQAFEGLKNARRKVRRPDCTLATTDHVSDTGRMGVFYANVR